MKNVIIAILLSSIIFVGCSVGPNYHRPKINEVKEESFVNSQKDTMFISDNDSMSLEDSISATNWWLIFNSPNLNELIELAEDNNRNLMIAYSRIDQAKYNMGFTKADYFPAFDFALSASRGNFSGARLGGITNNFYATPTLSWEIDFWGKVRRASESARASYLASEYGMRQVKLDLISSVINNYFSLIDYENRLRISDETLKLRENSLQVITDRFNGGVVSQIDVHQATIQRDIAKAAVLEYKRQLNRTKTTLSLLIGETVQQFDFTKDFKSISLPETVPVALQSELLNRRPDILEAEANFMAENANIGVAKAMMFPSFNITGAFGLASDDLSTLSSDGAAWSIGGSVLGPIFHFNKNRRRVDIQEEAAKQSMYTYEHTVLSAFKEVEDALMDLSTLKEELDVRKSMSTNSQSATVLAQLKYDGGATSYLELLESQRSEFENLISLSQTYKNFLSSYVYLYKTLGGGWYVSEQIDGDEGLVQSTDEVDVEDEEDID